MVLTRTAARATPMPPGEDLAALGATGCTLVLHLAVQNIDQVAADLLPHYGADCPAAVVARASWPDEVVLRCTLGELAEQVRAGGHPPHGDHRRRAGARRTAGSATATCTRPPVTAGAGGRRARS